MYGYRLYNSYIYKNGNVDEERIVVSTIIQTTNDAIGYVFTDIENVTKSQGSPKTKSGISQSTFSDINTVSQLYKTVKRIDRKNGGLRYDSDLSGVLIFWELSGIILVEETEPRCELLLFVAGGTDWFPFILFYEKPAIQLYENREGNKFFRPFQRQRLPLSGGARRYGNRSENG